MGLHFRPARASGFTIIEILVVLVIIAILLAMATALTRGISSAQKRSVTALRIAAVDAAIVQYVQKNRRLPCPSDGSIASGMPNAGVEAPAGGAPCTGAQVNGVVPWVTLGLSEADATDGWDRRLTYRVGGAPAPSLSLAAANAMNMSQCDPAGTGGVDGATGLCQTGCVSTNLLLCTPPTAFLAGKGLEIRSTVGAIQMNPAGGTGAAYVVIAHGESGGGARMSSGQLSSSTTTDGGEEAKNYADLALQAYYVDDGIAEVAGANHFDDTVSRPSVLSVISKAALGPRSH